MEYITEHGGDITHVITHDVVAVLIEEFDANGNLVGSIIQDFQFEIIYSRKPEA